MHTIGFASPTTKVVLGGYNFSMEEYGSNLTNTVPDSPLYIKSTEPNPNVRVHNYSNWSTMGNANTVYDKIASIVNGLKS